MKKLFFIAALAMLAVGGATSQVYLPGGTMPIPCNDEGLNCDVEFDEPIGYSVPYNPDDPEAPKQDGETVIDLSTREYNSF